jgi:hypothetical protein
VENHAPANMSIAASLRIAAWAKHRREFISLTERAASKGIGLWRTQLLADPAYLDHVASAQTAKTQSRRGDYGSRRE